MPVEENLMQAILLTFGTAMVPVLELRGAIPVGVAAGLSPAAACLVSILGNMVPVPFILLLIPGSSTGSGAPAFSAPGSTGWSAGLT